MNYDAFMEPLTWFFTGMEKHSDDYQPGMLGNARSFVDAMRYHMVSFLAPSLQVAMNELSNHDHSRFLTRTNHHVGRVSHLGSDAASRDIHPEVMREAVVMQMTWPGAPTLYYGDEAGVCGFTDPDNRRTYPWGREDQQMLAFHKAAIAMHKKYPVLTGGSLKFLYEDYNILSYGRFSRRQQIIVVFNNNDSERTISLPVWMAGVSDHQVLQRVFYTDRNGFSADGSAVPGEQGGCQAYRSRQSDSVCQGCAAGKFCARTEKIVLQPEVTAWPVLPDENAAKGELPKEYQMEPQEPSFWNSRELHTEVLPHAGAKEMLQPEWTKERIEASEWTAELSGGSDEDKMIYPVDAGRTVLRLSAFSGSVFLACEVKK